MTFSVHGLAVSRGIAIGRAVLVASSRADVAHYFVDADKTDLEISRIREARNAVVEEITRLQHDLPKDAPHEISALLDVHLMLLQDEQLIGGVKKWITDRRYNAEWALTTQYETIARQFDDMEDEYLRERKADLEQVVERILRRMKGMASPMQPVAQAGASRKQSKQGLLLADTIDVPLVLIAHDISPADMLQFKQSLFAGFATDVGGKTSHTAIVARSMDIPAVVGARIELLANIELPGDTLGAVSAGAVGVGLFRSEFLFMGRSGNLPNEEEQYSAYRQAIEGMKGMPVTIRTVDIGSDKPLDRASDRMEKAQDTHLNPALGLRAIRWSLADPPMFLTQLRAILRAAAHGQVNLLVPMLAHASEIKQTLLLIDRARVQLDNQGVPYGAVQLGAMIEIPAAALTLKMFLKYFDFLSIGTNDLIQYTLAIDRADESVAHLYDPCHPAVLRLIADTIAECNAQGKGVSVCGEMAGDVGMTKLLLGLGLRSFSMHPSQILAVKQQILRADTAKLKPWADLVLGSEDPAAML